MGCMAFRSSTVDCTEAWKAFGSDTEAGRLLKKLYCGHVKPQISYPKPKTKPRDASVPFIPGGGIIGTESRTHQLATKVSDRAIRAPSFSKFKGERPELHPIDYMVGRRKPYSQIEKEIKEIKRHMDAYRKSCTRKKPNQEKEKLQQVFTYSAGTILPRELLPGADLLDRELSHAAALRVGKSTKSKLEQLEDLYDAVLSEVESRKTNANEMIALGRPEKAEAVEKEILERFSELRRIHTLMDQERSNNAGA